VFFQPLRALLTTRRLVGEEGVGMFRIWVADWVGLNRWATITFA
jgi:hypothetical protein